MIYQLDNVGFKYPESANTLLAHFNLQINSRERWALIGPSGCGKTTLLYLLAGLKSPTEGSVLCQGKPAAAPMDRVSFIQQQYGLFRWKTVRKNLALPLLLKKTPRCGKLKVKKGFALPNVSFDVLWLALANFCSGRIEIVFLN